MFAPPGEGTRVNPGSEPERDDTGLPPIDIEIPDDARELDRDVQAYHRELRAQRRNSRSSRLHRVLARDGILSPLLACCVIFALIAGTLLTVFTASGIERGVPGAPGAPGASTSIGLPGTTGGPGTEAGLIHSAGPLPAAPITEAGRSVPLQLQHLQRAAVLLVPRKCDCATTLAKLAALMKSARVTTLLVPASGVPASELQRAEAAGAVQASDPTGVLRRSYQHVGLTAILVAPGGQVHYAEDLQQAPTLTGLPIVATAS
jgi:hypothetical protein